MSDLDVDLLTTLLKHFRTKFDGMVIKDRCLAIPRKPGFWPPGETWNVALVENGSVFTTPNDQAVWEPNDLNDPKSLDKIETDIRTTLSFTGEW